jgi:hypothetical protein
MSCVTTRTGIGHREIAGQRPAQDLRRLCRRPRSPAQIAVLACGDRARLHGHAGAAVQMKRWRNATSARASSPAASPTRWVKRDATLPPGCTRPVGRSASSSDATAGKGS